MGRKRAKPLTPQVKRLIEAYGCEPDDVKSLAGAIGAPYSTVANWHKRGGVPDKWLYKAAEATGRNVAWLEAGEGRPSPERSAHLGQKGLHVKKTAPSPHLPGRISGRAYELVSGDSVATFSVQERPAPAWQAGEPAPRAGGRTPDWGRTGALRPALLPSEDDAGVQPLVLALADALGQQVEYQMLPRFMGVVAAGAAAVAAEVPRGLDRAGEFAFSFEWLRRNLAHTTGELATAQVQGDSMSPTLLDGETIIIDRGVTEIGPDGVYVFRRRGRMLVKRLQLHSDDSLTVMSDNPKYKAEQLDRARVADLEIVGRMVWPRLR